LNLAHVLAKADVSALPSTLEQFVDPSARSRLAAQVVLRQINFPRSELHRLEHNSKWFSAGRELSRLVASGNYLQAKGESGDLIRALLVSSLKGEPYALHTTSEYNSQVVEVLKQKGVLTEPWLHSSWNVELDRKGHQVEADKRAASDLASSQFYSLMSSVLSRSFALPPRSLASIFRRHLAIDLQPGSLRDFVSSRKVIPDIKMNGILWDVIAELQQSREQLESGKDFERAKLVDDVMDGLVSLQRVLAPHDSAVSLSEPPEQSKESPVRYLFKREDKDAVTFLTGGNDSGVCDSTMDRQGFHRPHLAIKHSYQELGMYKRHKASLRRFGQTRLYAALDASELPTLIINSIDLESEERKNLNLYRWAIDHSAKIARQCKFRRLLIGRHGDMAISPFENHALFKDLRPVEAHVSLIDPFPDHMAFSDVFGGGASYGQKAGVANFYELDL